MNCPFGSGDHNGTMGSGCMGTPVDTLTDIDDLKQIFQVL